MGELWREGTITAAHEDGQLEHYIITFSDITERKKSEDQIRHLAEHDFLTDLPNRVLLLDRLNQQLAHCRRACSRWRRSPMRIGSRG